MLCTPTTDEFNGELIKMKTPDGRIDLARLESLLQWGGADFPSYQGFMNTAPVVPSGEGAPASGSPAATGGGTGGPSSGVNQGAPPAPTGAQPGGSPSTGQPGVTGPGSGPIDWKTAPAHFRTEYEAVKAKIDALEGLGGYESVQARTQIVNGLIDEAYTIGDKLGYDEADVQAALKKDFVKTVNFLRTKAAESQAQGGKPGGRQQGDEDLQATIDAKLKPMNEWFDNQLTETGNAKFTQTFQTELKTAFGDEVANLPKEFRQLLYDATSEMFKYDTEALKDLKFKGRTAKVAEHFGKARTMVEKAFNSYHQYMLAKQGRVAAGGQPVAPGVGGAKGKSAFSLDDVILGNDNALAALPSMKR
jgi:hypothetical protein